MRHALVMLSLLASPLAAQGTPLVGKWKITFPAGMKNENGVVTRLTGTGILSVEQVNDSLIGTIVADPEPGVPARPNRRLAAKAVGGSEATFISVGKGRIERDGEVREVTSIGTWKLKVAGDSLSGTQENRLEGIEMPSAGPQPVTGVRAS